MAHILGAYSRDRVCLAATKNITIAILFCYLMLLKMLKTAYILARMITFEAISMDLSPECDMNLKGRTKKVSQIPRGHSTHTHTGAVSPRDFKATLKY